MARNRVQLLSVTSSESWDGSLLAQLTARNITQGDNFAGILRVHGCVSADERECRERARSAENELDTLRQSARGLKPLRQQMQQLLLDNNELQKQNLLAQQREAALLTENSMLKQQMLQTKAQDAEVVNELMGNLEFYQQRSDGGASQGPASYESQINTLSKDPAQDAVGDNQSGSLPPVVATAEIVDTASGHDQLSGMEYTKYIVHCRQASCSTRNSENSTWKVAKRFSDFSALRTELIARPDIGVVVETLEFPEATWNFIPWGAGKLDATIVSERRKILQSWLNTLLGICPTEPAIRNFLSDAPAFDAYGPATSTLRDTMRIMDTLFEAIGDSK